MGDIKIDSKLFQERISHFISTWKADKRSGDGLFNGASSIVVLMGKVEENPEFHKNNAMHVSLSFPARLDCATRHSQFLVLASRIRISDNLDATYNRDCIHSHYPKERCAETFTDSHS
jgi:nucleosome binding factor SPN SPT16 subunit